MGRSRHGEISSWGDLVMGRYRCVDKLYGEGLKVLLF